MKILIITNLFPNQWQPEKGIFNKQQFLHLSRLCELRVVAPLPWIPRLPTLNQVAQEEIIEGIKTYHPRYFLTPKIGRSFYGYFFYLGIHNMIERIYNEFNFDVILATWAYPDAYAASLISQKLNKPLVIRVHGTDINVTTQFFFRRKMIVSALRHAKKIVAVSRALKEKIQQLGINADKISVIPNGINTSLFKKLDKNDCRKKVGFQNVKRYVLFIGNLVAIKGVRHLIDAVKDLNSDFVLNIIGDGEEAQNLKKQVQLNGLTDRVHFLGRKPHAEIPIWMNASDIFCLPSLNEGCPNVIIEALGCQIPIVATKVGAIPELIDSKEKGILVNPAHPQELTKAINEIVILNVDSQKKLDCLTWDQNASELYTVLTKALNNSSLA